MAHGAVGGEDRAAEHGRFLSGSPSASGKTSVAGTTEYSARPAIEYIASGEPSARAAASCRRRACPSAGSSRRSCRTGRRGPAPHAGQKPHGMMNAETTGVPTAGPVTPGPSAATCRRSRVPSPQASETPPRPSSRAGRCGRRRSGDLDQDLAGVRLGNRNLFDAQVGIGRLEHCGFHRRHSPESMRCPDGVSRMRCRRRSA